MCLARCAVAHYCRGMALIELMVACLLMALLASSSVQVILWQLTTVTSALKQAHTPLEIHSLALQLGRDIFGSQSITLHSGSNGQSCYIILTAVEDQVGYRLNDGVLQYHGNAVNCDGRGWQGLSVAQSVPLTQFEIISMNAGYLIRLASPKFAVELPLSHFNGIDRSAAHEQLYDSPSVVDWHTCVDHALCNQPAESAFTTLHLAMATVSKPTTTRL